MRLNEELSRGRIALEEYESRLPELNTLLNEVDEKGTVHDRLIEPLYIAITIEPSGTLPIPVKMNNLSLEEFRQFRSKVEAMSDEEIRKEIRKAKDEYSRKSNEIDKARGGRNPFGGAAFP